ncbi:serine-rich adhesin for platelets-like [Lytechinus pictus]|uniref:serine-rich adhesin for platelets-like n=1 Tax=Lytechinus pictus TaxID=7653 RepID=UPI0030B9E32A
MDVSIQQSGDLSVTAAATFQTFTDVPSSLYVESPSVTQHDSAFSTVESSATSSVIEWTDTGTLATDASKKTGTLSYLGSSVSGTTVDSSFVHTSADSAEATYSVSTEGISGSTTILEISTVEQSFDVAVSITSSGMLGSTEKDPTGATYLVSTEGTSDSTTIIQSATVEPSSDVAVSIMSSGMLGSTETGSTAASSLMSTEDTSDSTTITQSATVEPSSDVAVSIMSSGMLGSTETGSTAASSLMSTEDTSDLTTITQSATVEPSPGVRVSVMYSGMLGSTESVSSLPVLSLDSSSVADSGGGTVLSTVQPTTDEVSLIPSTTYNSLILSQDSTGSVDPSQPGPSPQSTLFPGTSASDVGMTTQVYFSPSEQLSRQTIQSTSDVDSSYTSQQSLSRTSDVSTLDTVPNSLFISETTGVTGSVVGTPKTNTIQGPSGTGVSFTSASQISPTPSGLSGSSGTVEESTDAATVLPTTMTIVSSEAVSSQESIVYSRFTPAMTAAVSSVFSHISGVTSPSIVKSPTCVNPSNCQVLTGSDISIFDESTSILASGYTSEAVLSSHNNSQTIVQTTMEQGTTELSQQISTSDVDSSYTSQQSLSRTSDISTLDTVPDSLSISETTGVTRSVVGTPKTNTIQGPSGTGVSFTSASQISTTPSGLSGSSGKVEESTDAATVLPTTMTIVSSEAVSRFTPAMTAAVSSVFSHISGVTSPSTVESPTCMNPSNCQVLTGSDISIFDESTSILASGYTSEAVLSSHNNSQTIVQTTMAQGATELSQQISVMSTVNASAMSESSQLGLSTVLSSDEITSASSDLDSSIQTTLAQSDNSGLMSAPVISTAPYSQLSESATLVQISVTFGGQPATTISGSTREPLTDSLRTSPTATTSTSSSVAVTNPAPAPAPSPAVHVPDIIFKVYIPAPAPAPAAPPAPVPAPSPAPTTTSHPPTQSQPETTTETADEAKFLSDYMTILIFAGATLFFVGVVVVIVICIVRHYSQSANKQREETLRMVLLPQRWWRNNIQVQPANDVPSYNDNWNSGFNDGNYDSFDLKKSKDQRPSIIPPITDAWF